MDPAACELTPGPRQGPGTNRRCCPASQEEQSPSHGGLPSTVSPGTSGPGDMCPMSASWIRQMREGKTVQKPLLPTKGHRSQPVPEIREIGHILCNRRPPSTAGPATGVGVKSKVKIHTSRTPPCTGGTKAAATQGVANAEHRGSGRLTLCWTEPQTLQASGDSRLWDSTPHQASPGSVQPIAGQTPDTPEETRSSHPAHAWNSGFPGRYSVL